METIIKKILLVSLLILRAQVGSSADFVNLNFESADLTGYPPESTVPAANAFPGWTVGARYILYDNFSLSGEAITIIDTNSSYLGTSLEGRYYAFFAAGNSPSGTQTISLGQSGTIPLGTHSITFWGNMGGLQITFAGQSLAFTQTGSTPNYNIYAADVSAFAGQTGQLLFSEPAYALAASLDNIQLSASVVPEPGVFGLFALAVVTLGLSRARGGR